MEEGSIFVCQKCLGKDQVLYGKRTVCRIIVKGSTLIIMDGGYSCGEFVREEKDCHNCENTKTDGERDSPCNECIQASKFLMPIHIKEVK